MGRKARGDQGSPSEPDAVPRPRRHPVTLAVGLLLVAGIIGAAGFAAWTLYSDYAWHSSAEDAATAVAEAVQSFSDAGRVAAGARRCRLGHAGRRSGRDRRAALCRRGSAGGGAHPHHARRCAVGADALRCTVRGGHARHGEHAQDRQGIVPVRRGAAAADAGSAARDALRRGRGARVAPAAGARRGLLGLVLRERRRQLDRRRRRSVGRLAGDRAAARQRPRVPVPGGCGQPGRRVGSGHHPRLPVHRAGPADERECRRRLPCRHLVDTARGRWRPAHHGLRRHRRAGGLLHRRGGPDALRDLRPPGGARVHLHRPSGQRGRRRHGQQPRHRSHRRLLGPRQGRGPVRLSRGRGRAPDLDVAAA